MISHFLFIDENNFKDIIKKDLNKIVGLSFKEKCQIIDMISSKKFTNELKFKLKDILKIVSNKELLVLMGKIDNKSLQNEVNYEKKIKDTLATSIEENKSSKRKYIDGGKIDLDYYGNIIVNKYKDIIRKRRKALGFPTTQKRLSDMTPIMHNQVRDIDQIVSKSGRTRYLWFGLVYQITVVEKDGNEGKKYAGMTAQTLKQRWHWYVKTALEKQEHWHYPIIKLIRKVLFDETKYDETDLKIREIDWNWAKINAILEPRFKREVKIICFNSKSLKEEERKYIRKYNLIKDGLNIRAGGEGGHAIDLPMFKIAKMITKGMSLKEMEKIINWVTHTTIWDRINDYWISYENSLLLFLRPMLKLLIISKFELYEINETYNRFMHDTIKTFFEGLSYRQLIDLKEEEWNSLDYEHLSPRTITGQVKYMIPGKILKDLILRNKTAISAIDDPSIEDSLSIYCSDVARQQIVYQIQQQLDYDSWINARRHICGNFIIKNLKNRTIEAKEIYMRIGYDEPSAYTHTTLTQIYFFGLTTEKLKEILQKNPYIEKYIDLKKYIDKLKSKKTKLPKTKIDKLLLRKLKSKDMIQEIIGWSTKDFLKEVKKYYPNFKEAKWIVKAPYIINKFRNISLPYDSNELNKIVIHLGYSNSVKISSIIRDMLFGMGLKDAIALVRYYPGIKTYQDALEKIKELNNFRRLFKAGTSKKETLNKILDIFLKKEFITIKQIANHTGFLKRTIRGYLKDLTSQGILERKILDGNPFWKLKVSKKKLEKLFDDSPIKYPWDDDPSFSLKNKIKPIKDKE